MEVFFRAFNHFEEGNLDELFQDIQQLAVKLYKDLFVSGKSEDTANDQLITQLISAQVFNVRILIVL